MKQTLWTYTEYGPSREATTVNKILTVMTGAGNVQERTISYEVIRDGFLLELSEQGFFDYAAALKVAVNLP